MKRILCICLILFSAAGSLSAFNESDRQAITDTINQFAVSWNQNQGHGISNPYAQDADFVNIAGMRFSGKDQIEAVHRQFLRTSAKDTYFKINDIKIREVKPDVAIVHVSWMLLPARTQGIFTHVFVKANGSWQIEASQNTLQPSR